MAYRRYSPSTTSIYGSGCPKTHGFGGYNGRPQLTTMTPSPRTGTVLNIGPEVMQGVLQLATMQANILQRRLHSVLLPNT
jgi:hypothetical protein